jgi:hypothetical protein
LFQSNLNPQHGSGSRGLECARTFSCRATWRKSCCKSVLILSKFLIRSLPLPSPFIAFAETVRRIQRPPSGGWKKGGRCLCRVHVT